MAITGLEQGSASVHWDKQRGSRNELLVVKVTGVDPRRRTTERYWFRSVHEFGPLMNTDERGFFDSVTERVIGAVFEVSGSYLKMDFAIMACTPLLPSTSCVMLRSAAALASM